jgi:hypothetical protein
MASFAAWDAASGRFVLGPPLQGAQEIFPKQTTVNTTFELAYWRFGLETAQRWRERLSLARDERLDRVLERLSPLPVRDGRYLFAETAPASYEEPRWARDHPSVVGALGMLPGKDVDADTMRRSFDWIWTHWSFPDTWGWLGLPAAGDERGAPGPARPRGRRAADGRAQERLPAERPQPPAPRTDDLPPGQRRAARGSGDDGGRLGRRAGSARARLPERRQLDRALGGLAKDAVMRRAN